MINFNNLHQNIYLYILYFSWFLYVISIFVEKKYDVKGLISYIDFYLKLYIACILIYKFNPLFGKGKLTKFDRRLVWQAGLFLLLSTLSISATDFI